jgi:hypothetical protein
MLVRDYKYLLNGIDMSLRYFYSVALKNKQIKKLYKNKIIMKKLKVKAKRSYNGSEFTNKIFVDFLDKKKQTKKL